MRALGAWFLLFVLAWVFGLGSSLSYPLFRNRAQATFSFPLG